MSISLLHFFFFVAILYDKHITFSHDSPLIYFYYPLRRKLSKLRKKKGRKHRKNWTVFSSRIVLYKVKLLTIPDSIAKSVGIFKKS